jgi:hypothetical protein
MCIIYFQAKRTAVVVHKLFNKVMDPDVRDEVRNTSSLDFGYTAWHFRKNQLNVSMLVAWSGFVCRVTFLFLHFANIKSQLNKYYIAEWEEVMFHNTASDVLHSY